MGSLQVIRKLLKLSQAKARTKVSARLTPGGGSARLCFCTGVSLATTMSKKLNKFGKIFFITGFFVFPVFCYAQENISLSDYQAEVEQYETVYSDVIDSVEFERCITYDTKDITKCLATEPTIKYLYDSKVYATEDVINKNTVKINDNTLKFYSGDTYYQKDGLWTKLETGYIEKLQYNITNEVKQVSPAEILYNNNPFKVYRVMAQTYSEASDGSVYYTNATSWDEAKDATTGSGYNDSNTNDWVVSDKYDGSHWQIYRMSMIFDTSALESTYTITDTVLHVMPNGTVMSNVGDIAVVEGDQATTLSTGEYNNQIWTEIAGRANTFVQDEYKEWTFNSTGNSYIDKDGDTKLWLIEENDIDDVAVTGRYGLQFYLSDQADTSKDPYLEITYTEASSTPPTATTTSSCEPDEIDDLAMITSCSFASSTGITYTNYEIPLINYLIIIIPSAWIIALLFIEFKIRLRAWMN